MSFETEIGRENPYQYKVKNKSAQTKSVQGRHGLHINDLSYLKNTVHISVVICMQDHSNMYDMYQVSLVSDKHNLHVS